MSIGDLVTAPCRTPQVVTTDVVSEHVVQWPTDAARNAFIHSDNINRVIVAVVAAGMASGIRFTYRFATNAALTGDPFIVADSGIILPAALASVGKVIQFRMRPIALPEGYEFSGGWFDLISEAGSGGFAVTWDIVDGADNLSPDVAAP